MSSEVAKQIVDAIEKGSLADAKELIDQGVKQKAAETVDMKRVELQVDWMNTSNETQGI
jgi:hypothetical protein